LRRRRGFVGAIRPHTEIVNAPSRKLGTRRYDGAPGTLLEGVQGSSEQVGKTFNTLLRRLPMLHQIVAFLLDVLASLFTSACLLRVYMQAQRVSFSNSLGQLVFALSDWLVLPLRRPLRAKGRWDWVSMLAAFLLQLLQMTLLWLLLGLHGNALTLPWLALCGVLRVALWCVMGVVMVYIILSWVQPYSPMYGMARNLAEPLLHPLRRVVPLAGGVDLSALVLMVLAQVALMVLAYVRAAAVVQWA